MLIHRLIIEAIGFAGWAATYNLVALVDDMIWGSDDESKTSLLSLWLFAALTFVTYTAFVLCLIYSLRSKLIAKEERDENRAAAGRKQSKEDAKEDLKLAISGRFVDLVADTTSYLSMAALSSAISASDPFPSLAPLWDFLSLVIFLLFSSGALVLIHCKTKSPVWNEEAYRKKVTLDKFAKHIIGTSTTWHCGSRGLIV